MTAKGGLSVGDRVAAEPDASTHVKAQLPEKQKSRRKRAGSFPFQFCEAAYFFPMAAINFASSDLAADSISDFGEE
jgi:hypothetical protein